jgi:hypothetical protein
MLLVFSFEPLRYVLIDCTLSPSEPYDTVVTLQSTFLVILVYPTNWWITLSNCYA